MFDKLFTPITIKDMTLRNRIIMPAKDKKRQEPQKTAPVAFCLQSVFTVRRH